jgi:hypothetical protein
VFSKERLGAEPKSSLERTITTSSQLKDFIDWPYLGQVFELKCGYSVSFKTGEVYEQTKYGFTSFTRKKLPPSFKSHHPTLRSPYSTALQIDINL